MATDFYDNYPIIKAYHSALLAVQQRYENIIKSQTATDNDKAMEAALVLRYQIANYLKYFNFLSSLYRDFPLISKIFAELNSEISKITVNPSLDIVGYIDAIKAIIDVYDFKNRSVEINLPKLICNWLLFLAALIVMPISCLILGNAIVLPLAAPLALFIGIAGVVLSAMAIGWFFFDLLPLAFFNHALPHYLKALEEPDNNEFSTTFELPSQESGNKNNTVCTRAVSQLNAGFFFTENDSISLAQEVKQAFVYPNCS